MIKICQECGLEFETANGKQKYCKRQHFRKCQICGREFEISLAQLSDSTSRTTCSKECRTTLRKQTNTIKYGGPAPASSQEVRAKMEATMEQRYGVKHAMQSDVIRERLQSTNLSRYGYAWNSERPECREGLAKIWQDPEHRASILQHIKETNLQKYGVECSLANPAVREKMHQTNLERYGTWWASTSQDVQAKVTATNRERYGVDRPLQSREIQDKAKATNLERYGVPNPMQNINIHRRLQSTCLQRYGNICYLQSEEGVAKAKQATKIKYGADYYPQSQEWKQSKMLDPSKVQHLIQFRQDPETYLQTHFEVAPTLRELAKDLGIHDNTAGQLVQEFGLQDNVAYVYSYMEAEIYNYLKSLDSSLEIVRNTHQVITPLEIDLYLPKYNLGIECNHTTTHNSSINTFDNTQPPLPPNYHANKTHLCNNRGVTLLHVSSSEWTYSREIIKHIIHASLQLENSECFSYNCTSISIDTFYEFLKSNYLFYTEVSNVTCAFGMYVDDELIQVAGFKCVSDNEYEVVCIANSIESSIQPTYAHLISYFIQLYHPMKLKAYTDKSYGSFFDLTDTCLCKTGEMLPDYVWVDLYTDISYTKESIVEDDLDDDNVRFVKMYNAGYYTWEWVAK